VDSGGRLYALVANVNEGITKYEADGSFTGFIGANPVRVNMAEYIWKRYFMTKEQRAASASNVSTEYENLYIDNDNFIYTTTTKFEEYDLKTDVAKPIRRLNGLGTDILVKNDHYPPIGDLWWPGGDAEDFGPSLLVDITVLERDMYVVLDRVRGRLFGYDDQGVMLWAFGTRGNIEGAFNSPIAIEHMGYDLFVLDQNDSRVTVFTPTEYGSNVYAAINEYKDGRYEASADIWRKVLKQNSNYSLAFRGIGRSYLKQNQYEDAMEYFKMAHDRENYGRAYRYYRKVLVEKNIGWIVAAAAVLLIVPLAVSRVRKTKAEVETYERRKFAR
jgi:tetratricopeptide (TPR) repeat protein